MSVIADHSRGDYLLKSNPRKSVNPSLNPWEQERESLKRITKIAERKWQAQESATSWTLSKKDFGEMIQARTSEIRRRHYTELIDQNPQAEWTTRMEMLVVEESESDLLTVLGLSDRLRRMRSHWTAVKEKNSAERSWVTDPQWKTWCFYRDQIEARLDELPRLPDGELKRKFAALESLILSASGDRVAPVEVTDGSAPAELEAMPDLTDLAASLRRAMKGAL